MATVSMHGLDLSFMKKPKASKPKPKKRTRQGLYPWHSTEHRPITSKPGTIARKNEAKKKALEDLAKGVSGEWA